MMTRSISIAATLALCTLSAPVAAQTVLSGDHSVDGSLCAGASCTGSESFTGADFKIKVINPELLFEDSSAAGAPTRDWRVLTNEDGAENFVIEDVDNSRDVFWIEGASRANSIYVSALGRVGLGTNLPQEEIHIAGSTSPAIRFETSSDGSAWDIRTNSNFWWVEREPGGNFPFVLANDAPSESFWMLDSGNIGFGTDTAEAKLHSVGDGVQLFYFDSADGGPVQMRFRTDSENRRFLATNNANEVQSQIIFGDNDIRFTGETDSGANLWLTISSAGIVSQGPTCGSPCDLTFDPEHFTVPPIAERAALMWENKHLPAIGPTNPDTPMNITEKTGGIIHELEVAHIYIEELHKQLQAQQGVMDAQSAEISALRIDHATRLARLEAVLQAQDN